MLLIKILFFLFFLQYQKQGMLGNSSNFATEIFLKPQIIIMVDIKNENGVYIASFKGRLDAPTAQEIQEEIEALLVHADKEIVLDCAKLEYISSAGLRLFLRIRKEVSAKGGKVSIWNLVHEVKDVFVLTGFDEFFDFHNS